MLALPIPLPHRGDYGESTAYHPQIWSTPPADSETTPLMPASEQYISHEVIRNKSEVTRMDEGFLFDPDIVRDV